MNDKMIESFRKLGFSELDLEVIKGEWTPDMVKVEEKPKESKSKSTENLEEFLAIIKDKFDIGQKFQNKDLFPEAESLGLTNRQTPSRLKALAATGAIEEIPGHSPKAYNLV